MVARAPRRLIALAAGLLAVSFGLAPPECAAQSASTDNSISAWFKRNGSADTKPAPIETPAAKANAAHGPLDKISAGFSKMGKSVKNTFTRTSQKTTSTHPKPKTEDDALSLTKPARPGADFYISLARFQERAGNQPGAIEQYKRALEVEPTSLPALLALARVYDRQGQLAEAMKYYVQATASHADDASVHNDQGLCYARQEKFPESIACLKKAVELQPERALYRNNLATVQVETGQIDQALATLSAVHGKTVAHYNVGFLLNKRNRTAEALKQFKLAAASDPSFEAARQWVDSLSAKVASEQPAEPPAKANEVPAAPADTKPSPTAVASFVSPVAKPAEAAAPASVAADQASGKASSSQILGRKAVAATPEPSVVVKAAPSAAAEPPEMPERKPEPATVAAEMAQPKVATPASSVVQSKTSGDESDHDGEDPKPRSRDTRRSRPSVLLSQRPTRLPPTPDQIDDFSRGATAADGTNRIVPLPPVDADHYPPSRY